MAKRPSLSSSMKVLQEDTTPDPEALVAAGKAEAVPAPAVPAASKPAEPKPAAKRYEGMKRMLIPMEGEMHRRLRMLAFGQGITLEKAVQAACAAYIEQHGGA